MSSKDTHREITIRRLLKKGGLRAGADAFCCGCIYDPYDKGTWREQVEKCPSASCALFTFRPLSTAQKIE